MDGACGPEGCGRLTAAGCVEGGGKKVQKVQKVQRVQRVVDCPTGNAYKVSVTGFTFVSPVLHDEEPEPPSLGRSPAEDF